MFSHSDEKITQQSFNFFLLWIINLVRKLRFSGIFQTV